MRGLRFVRRWLPRRRFRLPKSIRDRLESERDRLESEWTVTGNPGIYRIFTQTAAATWRAAVYVKHPGEDAVCVSVNVRDNPALIVNDVYVELREGSEIMVVPEQRVEAQWIAAAFGTEQK